MLVGAPANPFSGHLLPVPWLGASGTCPGELLCRLERLGGHGELLGPEGSGKTSLLSALAAEARSSGFTVLEHRVVPGQKVNLTPAAGSERALLCLDEADRWGALARLRLRWWWRRHSLIWVTHRRLGLPLLHATRVNGALAEAVVEAVLAQSPALPRLVEPAEIGEPLRRHQGNLREALLSLYRLYEERW